MGGNMAQIRRFLLTAVACSAALLLPTVALAVQYKVTIKNVDPQSTLVVQKILWTKNNNANGSTAVTWSIPPDSEQTRVFAAPAVTTDHGIQAVMSSGAYHMTEATDAVGLAVDSLALYRDQVTDSLYTGYDLDGRNSPKFCRSPMQLSGGRWACSDPRPVSPVQVGFERVTSILPALGESGRHALAALVLLSGVWVIVRRSRRARRAA